MDDPWAGIPERQDGDRLVRDYQMWSEANRLKVDWKYDELREDGKVTLRQENGTHVLTFYRVGKSVKSMWMRMSRQSDKPHVSATQVNENQENTNAQTQRI